MHRICRLGLSQGGAGELLTAGVPLLVRRSFSSLGRHLLSIRSRTPIRWNAAGAPPEEVVPGMTEAALATMGAGSAFAFSSRRNVIYGCRRRRPPVLTSTNRIVREANPNVAGDNLACRWGFSTAQGQSLWS